MITSVPPPCTSLSKLCARLPPEALTNHGVQTHLILSDEAIGFLRLLPLEEDHVLQWSEGQGLGRNPTRHCEGKAAWAGGSWLRSQIPEFKFQPNWYARMTRPL